jgi:hypothetical protein
MRWAAGCELFSAFRAFWSANERVWGSGEAMLEVSCPLLGPCWW